MATFDTDAYRAAREPFEVVLDGRTWRARPVSAELVASIERDLRDHDVGKQSRALRTLLRAAFPRTVAMWWRGDPVRRILHLDAATRNEVIRRFFLFLGGASDAPPATPGMP